MSSISCGIVGLPNVGKSTLFNSLTNTSVLAVNYPFATIEPNTGIAAVPEPKLARLAELFPGTKIIPATVTFIDIAGLVAGAHKGEGLGNQFLAHIRNCQALVQVVRIFTDQNVIHVHNDYNPTRDIEVVNTELILADLQTISRRIAKFEKETRANPKLGSTLATYKRVAKILDDGRPLWNEKSLDHELLTDLQLITMKPIIYVFNIDESDTSIDKSALSALVNPAPAIFICAALEDQLKDLNEQEAREFLISYGQSESGLEKLIRATYDALDLQSFFTAGPKEVRAWTIQKGTRAPQAGGTIHSDFERGFIAVDVVNYKDLIGAGSWAAAKAAGKVRTEGKTYVLKPQDVVEFRFNVSP
jgi:GTP-binding protein YchF